MRDKNLTFEQLNIQLEKRVSQLSKKHCDNWLLRMPVSASPTRQLPEVSVRYPRDFRLLRSLAIAQWYFPDLLHWKIWCDLTDFSFSWLNDKQKLELAILLSSKSDCEKYLYFTNRYSSGDIFGNILGNDLQDLLRFLKFSLRNPRIPQRKVRRRGYRDHGTRRPDHKWLETYDYTLTNEFYRRRRHSELLQRTIQTILSHLRLL